MLNFTTSFVLL